MSGTFRKIQNASCASGLQVEPAQRDLADDTICAKKLDSPANTRVAGKQRANSMTAMAVTLALCKLSEWKSVESHKVALMPLPALGEIAAAKTAFILPSARSSWRRSENCHLNKGPRGVSAKRKRADSDLGGYESKVTRGLKLAGVTKDSYRWGSRCFFCRRSVGFEAEVVSYALPALSNLRLQRLPSQLPIGKRHQRLRGGVLSQKRVKTSHQTSR